MASERLIIHNFAGISEINVYLGQINVLIGPQATGKSITAKSFYFFKSFLKDFIDAIVAEKTKRQFDAEFLQKFESYFASQNLGKKDFMLRYEIDNVFVQVERVNSKLRLSYSDFYKKELTSWRNVFKATLEKVADSEQTLRRLDAIGLTRRNFFNVQAQRLGRVATYSQVFIPAGRSFFSILESNIFAFLANNRALDPFLMEFGSFYSEIKDRQFSLPIRDKNDQRLKVQIDTLTESILQGKHLVEKGQDFLLLSDGRKISLASSSSGQQEMLPLALILGSIPFRRTAGSGGTTVYIEEPEAHLFPTAQRSIVNLIATIFNESRTPLQFLITTHSPYILTAFNNLIYAGNISSELPSSSLRKLEEVVPSEQLIKTENMRVYFLNNGTCKSIISDDTGLIGANALDTVSDELASQFDNILDIG